MDYWQSGWVRVKDLTPEIEADMDRRTYNEAARWGFAEDYLRERDERERRLERDSKLG